MRGHPQYSGVIVVGGFSLALFLGGSNGIAATSISREGQELFVKKYIPVSYMVQITAKVLSAFIMGFVALLAMIAFALVLFKLPIYMSLLILFAGCIEIILAALAGVLFDLHNPKLNWDSEHKAVKQNMNLVYNMVFSAGLVGLNMYAAISFLPGLFQAFILLVALYGLLVGGMYYVASKKGVERFNEL